MADDISELLNGFKIHEHTKLPGVTRKPRRINLWGFIFDFDYRVNFDNFELNKSTDNLTHTFLYPS